MATATTGALEPLRATCDGRVRLRAGTTAAARPYDDWTLAAGTSNAGRLADYFESPAYQTFTAWGDPTGPGSSGDPSMRPELLGLARPLASAALGAVGSLFGAGAGGGAGIGGPLLSALGSLGGGAIGSNAANEAARLQSQALNRGIDLQTAQWLQQQQNLAPYLQAGQGGLAQLQQLAGREQPDVPGRPPRPSVAADYAMPATTPGWQPQTYQGPQGPNAGDYRWTPGQGPQAADYRYTPGQHPASRQLSLHARGRADASGARAARQ